MRHLVVCTGHREAESVVPKMIKRDKLGRFIKGGSVNPKTEFKKGSIPFNKKHPEEKIIKSYLNGEKLIHISNKFNCGIRVIHKILKRKNISLRDRPKGENHSSWQGGISFEPYDKNFNNRFKRAIRKRDNYVCLKCLKHQEKEGKSLPIHHINYDKLLSMPENCCSLCVKCNSEVNFNRKHWIKFFQSLLSEKYGYQYSNSKIIIGIGKECDAGS